MSPEKVLQVTPPSEWKQARLGKLVELPSGRIVRVRTTFDLMTAVGNGFVPNPLAEIFQEQIRTNKPSSKTLTAEHLEQMNEFMRRVICKSVVEPKVEMVPAGEDANTWEPEDEDAVSIEDFTSNDRSFLFAVVQ